MKGRTAASILTLFLSVAASRAADPITVDLWPGGKGPGQKVEPGPDTVRKLPDNKQAGGTGGPQVRVTDVTRAQIVVYPAAKEKNTGTALIIAPGGGNKDLGWSYEGETMAEWCNKLGVTGIILKYRVPIDKGNPLSGQQDGQRAVSIVRSRASEWGIDPQKIGMIGFSAGGFVTNSVLLNFDKRGYEAVDAHDKASAKLDWAALIYSPGPGAKEADVPAVTKERIPPIFMAVAYNDSLSNSAVQGFMALKKAGVQTELHVYATGGHGFGGDLINSPAPLVGDWSHRLEDWMRYQKLFDSKKTP